MKDKQNVRIISKLILINLHGIMESTERHTADTQITTSADYKISAVASILQYPIAFVVKETQIKSPFCLNF
jgi:hypothetical protein